ncbi:MAG TPA: hypothetical protein PKD20_05460 [Candidatus Saccharibacteria bacterium]|jgi:hypothetical protein|nr:hypothetical protein [Candidatus Saccharibacteria bacterium]HMT56290.1 hypothetical protein [Candidatus Saccharibacteria bacterium]
MKYIDKLSIRIVTAVVIGILLAGAWTDIQYQCDPLENKGCVAFESAVLHPKDLINNKQGSLVTFSRYMVYSSAVCLAILTIINASQKRRSD